MQATRVVVKYSKSEARRQLRLAYATTVHKAQGNEWPVVVVVAHQSHYVMLTRGLLYTALSRAQNLCVVVATQKVRTCVCVCVWLCGCACVCGCVAVAMAVAVHAAPICEPSCCRACRLWVSLYAKPRTGYDTPTLRSD